MFAFLSADSSFTGSSNLGLKKHKIYDKINNSFYLFSGPGLAHPVVRLTVGWKVMVLIPREPILRVLKYLRNEGTAFAVQKV